MPLSMSTTTQFLHFQTKTIHFPINNSSLSPPLNTLTFTHKKLNLGLTLTTTITPHCTQQEHIVIQETEKEQPPLLPSTRILVQNVPWTAAEDDIRPIFENHGTVISIEFPMFSKTRNRGLAFVTMSSIDEARAVMENLNSAEFEGRVLKIDWAKARPEKDAVLQEKKEVYNVFVANLPFQARAKDVKAFFDDGNLKAVSGDVIFDPNRRATGYGFASFNSEEEAEAAIVAFQGKEMMGRVIRVARSKRFLNKGNKASVEADTDGESSEKLLEK